MRIVGAGVEPGLERRSRAWQVPARLRDDRVELDRLGQRRCARACSRTRLRGATAIPGTQRGARGPQIGARGGQPLGALWLDARLGGDVGGGRGAIALVAQLVPEIERAHAARRTWIG